MRPPGFLKLFPGARFSKFVVTLRGRDNSSPHKLVGCFSNLPGLSRNGPHKTLGFMETQGKAWGRILKGFADCWTGSRKLISSHTAQQSTAATVSENGVDHSSFLR